jgi:hypothetical protein
MNGEFYVSLITLHRSLFVNKLKVQDFVGSNGNIQVIFVECYFN